MESLKTFDNVNYTNDKDIKKIIGEEKIYFADWVKKINHFGMNQDRVLIITDSALYNTKGKSLKRKIPINEILGITYSTLTFEFIVHGLDNEYDYSFVTPDRNIIICFIAIFYEKLNKKPLKICEVKEKSTLKDFITSKKDKQADATKSKMNENFLVNTQKFLENYGNEIFGTEPLKKRTGTIFSKHKNIKEVTLDDFKIVKVIGRGSFGKVCLVQYKKSNEFYAMKSLKKDVLLDQDQVESTLLEKKILQSLDFPFLVGMVFCFQTVERIYFIMPFVRGGELFQHLRNEKFFPEEKVKFYAAIIGLSLDYLHNNGIVYRDIKPENILMDEDGYLKLADFGMAKILHNDEKAMSFCGTPEYLAPEIITGEGHNHAADWWSYGILIYEMLCGIPPFYNENVEKMYQLIERAELKFPKRIPVSENAKALIRQLLIKDQSKRLGTVGGFEKIKESPFFEGFDFKALLERKLEAPFKPKLSGMTDVTNFDNEFTSEDVVTSVIPEKNLKFIKANQDQFVDFNK